MPLASNNRSRRRLRARIKALVRRSPLRATQIPIISRSICSGSVTPLPTPERSSTHGRTGQSPHRSTPVRARAVESSSSGVWAWNAGATQKLAMIATKTNLTRCADLFISLPLSDLIQLFLVRCFVEGFTSLHPCACSAKSFFGSMCTSSLRSSTGGPKYPAPLRSRRPW